MVRSSIDPIRPGASLIIAWQIKHRHVLIIGGGFVAAGRLVNVLEADAKVTVVCPDSDLSDTVREYLQEHPTTTRHVARAFQDTDLVTAFGEHSNEVDSVTITAANLPELLIAPQTVDMVLSAIDDISVSTHIYNLSKQLRIPVNIADVIPQCDFYFCSTHRDQSLQIAVSTSGKGPKLANIVRRHVAEHLPSRVGDAIERVGELRSELRKLAPGPEVGPKRMQWMSRICEDWKTEELAELDRGLIKAVLEGFESNKVVSLKEAQALANPTTVVDLYATTTPTKRGVLTLVGAGPGDPELLTRKAVRLLEEADLVVADRLIPLPIIDLARNEVRIAPKKRVILEVEKGAGASDQATLPTPTAGTTAITSDFIQDQLNTWCLEGLLAGKNVVRLKQGDPFIFGRGAEEILFFRQHGFEPKVVPGITSALSAPLSANVPLTHRGFSDQVVITTAQAKGGVLPENFPAYDAKKTVVILMGVGKAAEISALMQSKELGWPGDVPVVIVENGNCSNERTMDATVATLAAVVEEHKAVPPSIFVVGWAGSVLRGSSAV